MSRSANLDFFAGKDDQLAVLDFIFTSSDVRVFESYSAEDADLREFRSTEEIAAAFPIGNDQHGNGHAILLQLWSPSVMSELIITRFALDPKKCNGHTFRHRIDGGGLIQLYFGGVCEAVITRSHYGHFSPIGAQKWHLDQGVNWQPLKTLSNQIQNHIRKGLAVGKAASCPVLPHALELAQSGFALKLAVQTPWQYELLPAKKQVAKPRNSR